jgi:predicted RNase H-like HicB family nuclease
MKEILITVKLTPMYFRVDNGYIGFVAELPGANTQGRTLEEARDNLREAVMIVLDTDHEIAEETLCGQIVTAA